MCACGVSIQYDVTLIMIAIFIIITPEILVTLSQAAKPRLLGRFRVKLCWSLTFEYEKGGFKYQSALHKTHFFVEEGVAIANNIVVCRHTLQKHRKQVFSVYYKERTARRRRENFGVLAKVLRVYPPPWGGGVSGWDMGIKPKFDENMGIKDLGVDSGN